MSSQLDGALPPDPLTRGSVPGPCWGLCSQTPGIDTCSALAMPPHSEISTNATGPDCSLGRRPGQDPSPDVCLASTKYQSIVFLRDVGNAS